MVQELEGLFCARLGRDITGQYCLKEPSIFQEDRHKACLWQLLLKRAGGHSGGPLQVDSRLGPGMWEDSFPAGSSMLSEALPHAYITCSKKKKKALLTFKKGRGIV
jgi:hypothetical protein